MPGGTLQLATRGKTTCVTGPRGLRYLTLFTERAVAACGSGKIRRRPSAARDADYGKRCRSHRSTDARSLISSNASVVRNPCERPVRARGPSTSAFGNKAAFQASPRVQRSAEAFHLTKPLGNAAWVFVDGRCLLFGDR